VNLLARNVYALTRNANLSETHALTASELASLEQLATLQHTMPAVLDNSWAEMAEWGWYPVINELQTDSPKDE